MSKNTKKCATMWCSDCGFMVGNTEKDMFNHKCKPKYKYFQYEGFVTGLKEYEDNDIALFENKQDNNFYYYKDKNYIIDFNEFFENYLGKRIRLTIQILE